MISQIGSKPTHLSTVSQASIRNSQIQEKHKHSTRLSIVSDLFLEEVFTWDCKRISDFPYDNFRFENTKQQYSSCEEYQRIMHPLLLLETWHQVIETPPPKRPIHAVSIDVEHVGAIDDFGVFHATVSDYSWESTGIEISDLCAIGIDRSGYVGEVPRTFEQFQLLDVINYAKILWVEDKQRWQLSYKNKVKRRK